MKKILNKKKVAVRFGKKESSSVKKKIFGFLKNLEAEVADNAGRADLAIIVGGDGTFLYWQSEFKCPLLGVKDKKEGVGYYMSASLEDFPEKISMVLGGKEGKDYFVRKLLKLAADLNGKSLRPALNEYLISSGRTRKMFNCRIKVDGKEFVERNSGIIVYTPTGSNAFAEAAGAKKLAWNCKKMGIAAVAPYAGILKRGEILLAGGEAVMECLDNKGEICVDGQEKYSYKIKRGDMIAVRKSEEPAGVIGFSPNFL
jgi:NAD kinase